MPSIRIADFDTWRPGYGLATVEVRLAGTDTLASIYTDEDLTVAASNPQTLIERIVNGVSYGRFAAPIYVGAAYSLLINNIDETGIDRVPIYTLEDEDASDAVVTPDGGSVASSLEDLFARRIDVRDFGEFIITGGPGVSTATNTATLTAAIGVAGGRGGGRVLLPSGTYPISTVTVPEGVVLEGEGREATILQSTFAGTVIVIGGNDAGLARLSPDGVTQVGSSIGVYATNRDRVVMDDVLVKRFEVGVYLQGGNYADWHNVTASDCVGGVLWKPTTDPVTFNAWRGGGAELCSSYGFWIESDNNIAVQNNLAENLFFDTNTGAAMTIIGAEGTVLRNCNWDDNTTNLALSDDGTTRLLTGLEITDGAMNTGAVTMTGTLKNVAFRRMRLTDLDVAITTPGNLITVEDCIEDGVAITGASTNWNRNAVEEGDTFGQTTSNAATKAWSIELDPGEHVYLEAKVIGRQINAVNHAFYHIGVSARRPGSTLAYDTQTSNFAAGRTITGGTSGATGVIQSDTDGGATGTLVLIDIVGAFVDNEIITDGAGGSATVNGTLTAQNAALVGSVTALRAAQETDSDWAATFAANGPEIELQVTGDLLATVEWTVDVDVTRNY